MKYLESVHGQKENILAEDKYEWGLYGDHMECSKTMSIINICGKREKKLIPELDHQQGNQVGENVTGIRKGMS